MNSLLLKKLSALGFIFLFTLALCKASPKNCVFDMGDNVYDLSSLAEKDYWISEDKDIVGNFSLSYFLSVCHPLRNLPTEHPCSTDNASAVCFTLTTNKDSPSDSRKLGQLVAPNAGKIKNDSFSVQPYGWVKYSYSDGAECEENGEKTNYTTVLHLFCPADVMFESYEPVLMSQTQCETQFAWATHAACPIKKERKISKCTDKFENSSELLNLQALHSQTYYNIATGINKYEVNICGPIRNGSCEGDDVTVCNVTDPSAPTALSTTRKMDVMWDGPFFTLSYNANTTETLPQNEKEVSIEFLCDRRAHDIVFSTMHVPSNKALFSASTSAICTPKEQECVIRSKFHDVIDLRPLRKYSGNWNVRDSRSDHKVSSSP